MSTGGDDDAVERVKKVIMEGWLWRKWHRKARLFFSHCATRRIFSNITDPSSFCGYFQPLSAAWRPSFSTLFDLTFCISFHPKLHC